MTADVADELAASLEPVSRELAAAVVLTTRAGCDRLGLRPTDVQALDPLAASGPVPVGRLREGRGLLSATGTRVVGRLERAGHLRRRPVPEDRREVILELVPGRAREVDEVFAPARRHLAALREHASDRDRALLLDVSARTTGTLFHVQRPGRGEDGPVTRARPRPRRRSDGAPVVQTGEQPQRPGSTRRRTPFVVAPRR